MSSGRWQARLHSSLVVVRHVPRTRNRTAGDDYLQAELVSELGHGDEDRRVLCP
jgi:hypothetical protein